MSTERIPASDDEMERIAEAAADRAVGLLFERLGIRYSDPYEMQKDFAHLREWRLTCEQVRGKGMLTMLSITITGIVALLVLGFKGWVN
jgi:hypothetical protein